MSFKDMIPSVRAQDSDDELVDPQTTLKNKCAENPHCRSLRQKLDVCNNRVNSRSQTTENCSEELFDYLHCVDHCVTEKLFPLLK